VKKGHKFKGLLLDIPSSDGEKFSLTLFNCFLAFLTFLTNPIKAKKVVVEE
jgi:hypothetical protein